MTGRRDAGQELALFSLDDLKPRPPAPEWPAQWAGLPAGPARTAREDTEVYFTGPCLYGSPVRGRAGRTAEFELWAGLFGQHGCAVDSHAWRPGTMMYRTATLDRHEPFLLDCDLRLIRDWQRPIPQARAVPPPCGHDGELLYRSACWLPGCDWEGPERGGGNEAVEDGMDHAWPGWRDLPTVRRLPEGAKPYKLAATTRQSAAHKTFANWVAEINAVYPEGWLESGGPIRTLRRPFETRHVESSTPWGGYDLGVPKTGPRGFPLCKGKGKHGGMGDCGAEGIGPGSPWCVTHWTPESDPAGAASAMRLGLLPCTTCDGTGIRIGGFTVGNRRVQVRCDCPAAHDEPRDEPATAHQTLF